MRIRSSTLIVIAAGLLGATIPRTGLAEVPGRALPPLRVAVTVHERATGEALQGNYGVLYTFPIRIDNPTAAPAALALVMHAVGGQAGGTFRIGDRIAEVPRVPAGGIQPVATFRVAPGEHRTLVISTMPESGANYPVLLTLEPQ